jgi:hypothetical protein
MSVETMKQALDALEELWDTESYWFQEVREDMPAKIEQSITALRAALEQEKQEGWVLREVLFDGGEAIAHREPEKQEPESFEAWNAKQHGDPEEIGFLQALRIAYCAGQDSVTKNTAPQPQPEQEPESQGLPDEEMYKLWLFAQGYTQKK